MRAQPSGRSSLVPASVCVPSLFSHVWLCATLWTVAHQVPLFMRFFQARILEWVAMPSSRGSSWPRNQTCISYVFLHWQVGSLPLRPPGKPSLTHTQRVLVPTLFVAPAYSFVASCPAIQASQVALVVKNLPANAGDLRDPQVWSLGWEDPWRRAGQPIPVYLPGEFHGQRSLEGYGPQGGKESDTTEVT